jgi:hypothetical protein
MIKMKRKKQTQETPKRGNPTFLCLRHISSDPNPIISPLISSSNRLFSASNDVWKRDSAATGIKLRRKRLEIRSFVK